MVSHGSQGFEPCTCLPFPERACARFYGLLVGSGDANFVPLNTADDILHAGLAVALLGSYFVTRDELDTVSTRRDRTVEAT